MRWSFLSRLMVLILCNTCLPELYAQETANQEEAAIANTLKMEETQVTAEREREHRYAVEDAVSATKTDTPLLEIPQAVSVVPRALLDDQDARTLDDVLQNVSGVTVGGYFGEWDYYRIRGFDVSYNGTYLDGLLNDSAPGEELWGLERVEVVKGPTSSLYGSGTPGDFVNLVSKRSRIALVGFDVCTPISIQAKEDLMKWRHATDEELHVDVHVDLCPDHSLHIQINNVCLHLCQKDFLQLAQAVKNTANQLVTAQATTGAAKPQVH